MVVELFAHGGGVKAVGDEAGGKREDRRTGVAVREGTRVGDEGEVDALGQFPGEGHASGVGDGGHHLARGGHAGVHPVPEGGEHGIAEVVVNIDGRILGAHGSGGSDGVPVGAAVRHDDDVVELLDDRRHFLGGLDDMGRLHVLFVHCINPH